MPHEMRKVRDEVIHLLPAILFFFAAFNLIVLTENLSDEEYGIRVFRFVSAAVASLLIAKVILVVEYLPFANAFHDRPLIYPAMWKTSMYLVAALVFVYFEHMVPLVLKHRSMAVAHRQLLEEMVWPRFTAILIWLAVLFFVFAAAKELARVVGKHQLRHMFIGR